MIPLSHLSFVQCEQVKFRPKKKVKIKESHSVVAVGTVCVWRGGGGCGGGRQAWHEFNFCNFFNLISFIILNRA